MADLQLPEVIMPKFSLSVYEMGSQAILSISNGTIVIKMKNRF